MKKIYIITLFAFWGLMSNGQPSITSFSPASGVIGTTVTITGANFNATPANNIVFFGATMATVSAATTSSLNVTVPIGASNQYISVTNLSTNLTAYSKRPFVVTFACSDDIVSSTFSAKSDKATGNHPVGIAVGDVDGDGKADLVFACADDNGVSVHRNTSVNGSGIISFSTKVNFSAGTYPWAVALGDLDGDGKLDLAVANGNSNSVSVLRNTSTVGNISFTLKTDYAAGTQPYDVAIGDLNADGKPDLVIANFSASGKVSVYQNTSTLGALSFNSKIDFTTGGNPKSISINDFDGDGNPDLVTANYNTSSNSISILKNTTAGGTISFAAKVDYTAGTNPHAITTGDLDGDGKSEIVVTNDNSNTTCVFRNTCIPGTISFAPKVDLVTNSHPTAVAIADLDGNGKLDIVVTNQGAGNVSIYKNTCTLGNISFAAKVDFGTGVIPYSLGIDDLDGDDRPDLAIGNAAPNTFSLLRNLQCPAPLPCGGGINTSSFAPKVDFASTNHPVSTALGDLDGDGKLDIALANRLSNTVSILLNTSVIGAVSFATKIDVAVGSNPWCVTIGDLDGDGKPDLAVSNGNSNTLSVFRNTSSIGSISFGPEINYITGVQPYCVAIGDLDADGKPELVVSNFNTPGIISVYKNTSTVGSLSFNSKIDFSTGGHPKNVAIGDFDGDGKPDLAVADYNTSSNTLSILRNTTSGSISFAAKVSYSTGTNPYAVAISDVDGDGKLDIAVPNSTSNTLSVFRNTCTVGTISFAAKVDFITGTDPVSIAMRDLDADGKSDIAVTNQASNTVSVFRNTCTVGTISFASKVDFSTGTTTYSLAIGDIDGDGALDIAAGNANSHNVSILRNLQCPIGIFTYTQPSSPIKIYPNPFSTHITIEIEEFQNEIYELRMYDMLGKEVLRSQILSVVSEISRGELRAGIYFIQVYTAAKIIANEKVIIQ